MSNKNLLIFEALKAEMKLKGITQQQVSNHVEAENSNLWTTIRNGKVKAKTLQQIFEFLELELFLVNPETNTETPLT